MREVDTIGIFVFRKFKNKLEIVTATISFLIQCVLDKFKFALAFICSAIVCKLLTLLLLFKVAVFTLLNDVIYSANWPK